MSGQSAVMSHSEVVSKTRAVEIGPNKTSGGNDPNSNAPKAMNVEVPCGTLKK